MIHCGFFETLYAETFKNRENCVLIDCHKNRTVHLVKCDEDANVFCGDKGIQNGPLLFVTSAILS